MIEKISTPKKVKVPDKLRKLVLDSVKRHAWNIGVSQYSGDILWMEEDKEVDGGKVHGECSVNRRYLQATISLYPIVIRTFQKEGAPYIEKVISHEVAHIATQHFMDVASARYCDDGEMKDAWETVTEIISKLSVKLDDQRRV